MKLLDDDLRARLPPLYAQEAEAEPTVYAKFFMPGTGWTWYVTEGSEQEGDVLPGLECADADEMHVAELGRLGVRGGEPQPAAAESEPSTISKKLSWTATICGGAL